MKPTQEQQRWDGHFDLLIGMLGATIMIFILALLVL